MHPRHATLHGLHRRRFLQLGGVAGLCLALPRLASANAPSPRVQSCILIYYYGGPSQLDTWDLKPGAPAEIRGEFRPIATSVSGVRVGELELTADVSPGRLEDRRSLLARLPVQGPMTTFQQRAFDLLRSERVRRAFDLTHETPATRDRYGRNTLGQSMLLARRLVEG